MHLENEFLLQAILYPAGLSIDPSGNITTNYYTKFKEVHQSTRLSHRFSFASAVKIHEYMNRRYWNIMT
jgi:hypothetical protein